ncbi:MAG: class I SAM-dependent methyltransferase [Kaistella sp.]|nr:class I SAM-dependent methyltransferase [Kaistella sp.]
MNQKEIAAFYNEFSDHQLKIGVNERLISLYKRLLNLGLQEKSNVLELGCGIGNFTHLLSKKVRSGHVEAVDLSEKSIEIAKRNLAGRKRISFTTADVVTYTPAIKIFDFVTLMDVIEHIPVAQHPNLFKNISSFSGENTLICINIPNPEYLEFAKLHTPEQLQVIDQPIRLLPLLNVIDEAGLEVTFFEKYSIWEVEDYHFLVLRKKRAFKLEHLSDKRNFSEKITHRISTLIRQIKYK